MTVGALAWDEHVLIELYTATVLYHEWLAIESVTRSLKRENGIESQIEQIESINAPQNKQCFHFRNNQ